MIFGVVRHAGIVGKLLWYTAYTGCVTRVTLIEIREALPKISYSNTAQ